MIALAFAFLIAAGAAAAQQQRDVYIVHVDRQSNGQDFFALEDLYGSFLPASRQRQDSLVYSYRHVASGFAARLTAEEAEAMSARDGVLSAQKQRILSLHTTHTPNFLGLNQQLGFVNGSSFGRGVIVGVLDTGIFPAHPSFEDQGMNLPPAKWKGSCDFGVGVCNKKLIGARNFVSGSAGTPPADEEGHGTHTASTAAGGFVRVADALGQAKGIAVGMAPAAHLAMYKVCDESGCADSDILAAMDAAIEDGVDVLSLSLGGGSSPFYLDSTAVGAFAAIQKGIFVSCSAGNSGPDYQTLSNEAPWILTVGASTVDRKVVATAKLGDGQEFPGESLFQPKDFASQLLPLIYPGRAGNESAAFCAAGSLKDIDVRGMVVVCDRGGGIARLAKGQEVKDAGGAAMILANDGESGFTTLADAHVLPATNVDFGSGWSIKRYINSTDTPTATIVFQGTVIGDSSAPAVASFSSRGPSLESPGVLKPDIVGPGVSILAAWPFDLENQTLISKSGFNMVSGTSMSCPHLSGIAALIKSSHPDWSPAAIKSAIMTSATPDNLGGNPIVDQTNKKADIFATGAGHVNPTIANDPGLVYDAQPDDYIPYLCGLGYKDKDISIIVHKAVSCAGVQNISETQLNYPTFSVVLGNRTASFTRTVTNVGPAISSYDVQIAPMEGVGVAVSPGSINFTAVGQTATYSVSFVPLGAPDNVPFSQGYVRWVSDRHSVNSPITVLFTG